MPKDQTVHIEKAQKQRIKIREKSKFYSPGTVNIQILGSGARGSPATVYLFSEQARYLFNCGEGTQRLAHEHRTKLTRMEHIFLTRKTWKRFGGIPGLCLTLQEIGVPKLNLHGPAGISDIFESTRKFVVLRNMKVEAPKCTDDTFFEDSVLKVNYVPLYKNNIKPVAKQPELVEEPVANDDWGDDVMKKEGRQQKSDVIFKDDTDYYGYENKRGARNNNREESTRSIGMEKNQIESQLEDNVMSYICKLQPRAGTLDLAKCVEKGVQPGPLLGQLKNGINVTLKDGTVVMADEVRGPSSPGAVFIFIDIPEESYLEALVNCDRYTPHQKTTKIEDDVALVVIHFTPEEIVNNPIYREWMDKFSASTKHLMVNERNEFTGFFASHRIQRQLNELDNEVFPMLKEEHPYLRKLTENVVENPSKKLKIDTDVACGEDDPDGKYKEFPELGILSSFHLRPPKGFDRSFEPYSNPEKVAEDTLATPELKEMITKFKKDAEKLTNRTKTERDQEYPKVLTFGTGSCIPNKTRNVSSNLVHVAKDNCVLMDCGEGTLGQLVRFYGRDGADEVLKNLRWIYISHLHADHHLGLMNILNRRRKLIDNKVVLIAPIQINAWLSFYNYRIEEIFNTFDLFPCADLLGWNVEEYKLDELRDRLGLVRINTCFVKHCPHSFGISFEMKNSMLCSRFPNETVKITYSGDTLPSADLVHLGQDSDILIHEATMEDDLVDEARIKMHSTASQAIEIGEKMNAKYTILTHFSQRYAKIPLLGKNVENVAVAFDNMEVTLNDMPKMHLMYEPLKLMFSDHFQMMEQKALKRKYQKERKININLENGNSHNKVKKFDSSDEN